MYAIRLRCTDDRRTATKAIVQETYGSPEVLQLRDIARPVIAAGEVLVRVRAAGVNPAAWAIMSGLPYIARPVYGLVRSKNAVRGTDVAGAVDAVGADVTLFKPGDEVFGWSRGSYAEYAAAAESTLAIKPPNLTFEQAAAVPMAGLVALQAVRDHGKVQSGQSVLINGASGGIGTFLVALLVLGIFNLGFFAMIGYVIVGPTDGAAPVTSRGPAQLAI